MFRSGFPISGVPIVLLALNSTHDVTGHATESYPDLGGRVKSVLMMMMMLMADTHTVVTDKTVDFSAFKTFVIHEGYPTFEVPLRFSRGQIVAADPTLVQAIRTAIRNVLSSKGLTEASDSVDLIVNFRIEIEAHQAEFPGFILRNSQPAFSVGMISIDLSDAKSDTAIWHAHYIENEESTVKVEKRMPGDVKKLLSEFPKKK
jgi:hypothetical protein